MAMKRTGLLILLLGVLWSVGCARPNGIGLGGRYLDAKSELTKRRGGDLDKAVSLLEGIAVEDPLYKNNLTLLVRAYYKNGRYPDTLQMASRALAVNPKDEITWITLGLAQLRTRDDANGLASLKGGLSLLSKVSKDGYRGIESWDRRRVVRNSISKTAFLLMKGIEEKENIIRSGDHLLIAIDDEEYIGRGEQQEERR